MRRAESKKTPGMNVEVTQHRKAGASDWPPVSRELAGAPLGNEANVDSFIQSRCDSRQHT